MEPPLPRWVFFVFVVHSVAVQSQSPKEGDLLFSSLHSPPPSTPVPPLTFRPPSPLPRPSPSPLPQAPPQLHPPPPVPPRPNPSRGPRDGRPPTPPPPRRNPNRGPRHGMPPPPPPQSSRKLNTGKKIGLLFTGIVAILQIGVVGFLFYKRRQLLK